MATKNPHEIARVKARDAAVAEAAEKVSELKSDLELALDKDNDRLRDQVRAQSSEIHQLRSDLQSKDLELAAARAEIQRLTRLPSAHE